MTDHDELVEALEEDSLLSVCFRIHGWARTPASGSRVSGLYLNSCVKKECTNMINTHDNSVGSNLRFVKIAFVVT